MNTQKSPLVFIPGAWSYSPQFTLWMRDTEAAGFDARGLTLKNHGDDRLRVGYLSIKDLVLDAINQIEKVGIPAHLVGHSLGGLISLIIASTRPKLVRSVTTICSSPPRGIKSPFQPRLLKPLYIWALITGRAFCLSGSDTRYLANEPGKGFETIMREQGLYVQFGPESGRVVREIVFGKYAVPNLNGKPLFVAAGKYDRCQPVGVQAQIANRFSGEKHLTDVKNILQISEGGHMLHLGSQAQKLRGDVLTWISQIEANTKA